MEAIGDRMKQNYESVTNIRLVRRMPVIVRVDGRCCHSLKLKKPFDERFISAMVYAARMLADDMQGFKLAFVQSDEASFLLTDYDDLQTQGWFDYEVRKIVSISAAAMTLHFNELCRVMNLHLMVMFDGRAFNVPREEVANYFLWRALDWQRNSVQMLAQANFSHKELMHKNQAAMHEMLHGKGINWANCLDIEKNGTWILGDGSVRDNIRPKYEEIAAVVEPYIQATP